MISRAVVMGAPRSGGRSALRTLLPRRRRPTPHRPGQGPCTRPREWFRCGHLGYGRFAAPRDEQEQPMGTHDLDRPGTARRIVEKTEDVLDERTRPEHPRKYADSDDPATG